MNWIKKNIRTVALLMLVGVIFTGAYALAGTRILTVSGEIMDPAANDGKGQRLTDVPLTLTLIKNDGSDGAVLTPVFDQGGRYTFKINVEDVTFARFRLATTKPAGYRAIYAANNNLSNFWETTYQEQVAGISCRSERSFCFIGEVARDKSSSSSYHFTVEPEIKTCTNPTGTLLAIPSPELIAQYATSEPGVATDGKRIYVVVRGIDSGLWLNETSSPERGRWGRWTNAGGFMKDNPAPSIRLLGRNSSVIFSTGMDGNTYALMREGRTSRTPFVNLTEKGVTLESLGVFHSQTVIYKGVMYNFFKTSDGRVSYQTCNT